MKIAVLGAGIVGVTTAYELSVRGHEVTVFDRRASVAAESSFGHGNLLAASALWPNDAPGLPGASVSAALGSSAAAWGQLPWLWRCWRASRPARRAGHLAAIQRLALHSRKQQDTLSRLLKLSYEQQEGCLVLLRSAREAEQARRALAQGALQGTGLQWLDEAQCRELEPALNPKRELKGGLRLPLGGVGNSRQFAQLLKTQAQRHGARFVFDSSVRRIVTGARPTLEFAAQEAQVFDAVVVCAGVGSGALLAALGLNLRLIGVHGYSITAPVRIDEGDAAGSPRAAVVDAASGVSIARLGQRVRVAGLAEFGRHPTRLDPAALQRLHRLLDEWFPGAAVAREAQHWKGARPTLPDGLPVLGPGGLPGLWLNVGHGGSGWSLACGSAHALAEQMSGHAAPFDMTGLGVERLR